MTGDGAGLIDLSPLALAELSLDLGYERDSAGLLIQTRDPDPRDVRRPLVHLVRTVEGNRWLLSASLSREQRAALEAALEAEPLVAWLAGVEERPPEVAETLANLLPRGPAPEDYRGPAFVFPEVLPALTLEVERIEDPRGLATVPQLAWVREATPAAQPLCVARNSRGEVVAVCHSSRSTAEAAAAGVETAEAYRLRGLGTAVVVGWAAAVRAEGRLPLYGTSWTNLASRAIARKLGLVNWGEDWHAG